MGGSRVNWFETFINSYPLFECIVAVTLSSDPCITHRKQAWLHRSSLYYGAFDRPISPESTSDEWVSQSSMKEHTIFPSFGFIILSSSQSSCPNPQSKHAPGKKLTKAIYDKYFEPFVRNTFPTRAVIAERMSGNSSHSSSSSFLVDFFGRLRRIETIVLIPPSLLLLQSNV